MSSGKPKILLIGEVEHAHREWEALSNIADIVETSASNREEFIRDCRKGNLDGVVAAYRTLASVSITGNFDQELIDTLPKSWIFLCHGGAGYDQINIEACTARQPPLYVSNTPNVTDDATADTAIFLLIGTLRNFYPAITSLRRGEWRGNPLPNLGHDPQKKVLGILGMGSIGINIAKKARALGMTIIYHSRRKLAEDKVDCAEYVSFEDLLRRSDVLSLNLPLNPKTHHIIATREFKLMKPSAVVINTARGPVIDEAALVQALNQGLIAGAGLDVYENEPKIHNGLLESNKVILLPHMGTWTVETQYEMEICTISNISSALKRGNLISVVPEQAALCQSGI
ncbi:D-isomer specific 2-hydroxyacid dehydrogenase [Biscogniauxia mediterranea]|nr:D-isomer specific 2-hydroxyacid dehydrogenase [Biscogniauxia mediterranea]